MTVAGDSSCRILLAALLTLVPFASLLPQTGRVEGTVWNSQTLTPVHGARVSLVGTDLFSVTNADGEYVIRGVPVGVHDIRVQAIGFRSVTYANQRVTAGLGMRLIVYLDPTPERGELETFRSTRRVALPPGLGIGGSAGMDGLGGTPNRSIRNAVGFEVFIRYGTRSGLFVLGGVHVSHHGIEQVRDPYGLFAVYLEPRFVALGISPSWAPFLSGRIARAWERTEQPGGRLAASGYSVGGGGGVLLRLIHQVAIEGSVSIGKVTFGDYRFTGDVGWYNCLNGTEPGTPLPESVLQCAGSAGSPLITCYPPFYPAPITAISGDCTPPEIRYPGSGRTATWVRIGLGLNLSFASR
ncbi:MAG: hypothetical protein GTN62_05815 [Gemmatimonadales bacterium]|nr:hypothetical protein [Gemmatimonadales bacterium]NIN11016.1 hypothetical protein [Gemmatimonadales bacterium]NIN49613.1 hypothetical protein [Gemmatimonadales bacterium]NIP07077.1 hypothetical protein [Gemmatimonadales bacterium]NIQ99468.1 hypothetical protein [Gemmatimonadales bacterium]